MLIDGLQVIPNPVEQPQLLTWGEHTTASLLQPNSEIDFGIDTELLTTELGYRDIETMWVLDGVILQGNQISHTFTDTGSYFLEVTITSQGTEIYADEILVHVGKQPAKPIVTANIPIENKLIKLSNAKDLILEVENYDATLIWEWDIGNEIIRDQSKISLTPDSYTVASNILVRVTDPTSNTFAESYVRLQPDSVANTLRTPPPPQQVRPQPANDNPTNTWVISIAAGTILVNTTLIWWFTSRKKRERR